MFEQSKRALTSIIDILKKILDAFSIILFIGFTLFYGYQIYVHLYSFPRIYIYSALIIVHTISFIFSKTNKVDKDASHSEKYVQKKAIRVRRNLFKIVKMSINAGAIIWNIIEIFTGSVSDLNIMIVIISAIFLFTQVVLEIVLNLLLTYFDNLRIAVIDDIKNADQENSFKVKMFAKILGQTKNLKRITDENYLSDEEKEIAKKQREKK